MPVVTGLRAAKRGRVMVDIDGRHWRTFPAEVALSVGIAVGVELERSRLRELRRELRKREALDHATQSLRYRELSSRRLRERLRRRRTAPVAREQAVTALERVGLVDDARLARTRAESLAARSRGDLAIRFDLERQGIAAPVVEEALARLEPELERARRLVDAHGTGLRTARLLARRGFDEETVRATCGLDEDGP